MYCFMCGTKIEIEGAKFCPKCGAVLDNVKSGVNGSGEERVSEVHKGITYRINKLTGGEGDVDLHLRDMVSDVFKHHKGEETGLLFACGTSATTPKESEILSEWPKPWLYSRVLILLIGLYFALTFMWLEFNNPYALVNISWCGTLIGPFTILVFFFEMNVPRNISIINTVKVFVVGGVASLLVALTLFAIGPDIKDMSVTTAIIIGIIEEVAKLVICAYFISIHQGKIYLLNGILYGGAVGAGFAVFESIGFALTLGMERAISLSIQNQGFDHLYTFFYDEMIGVVKMRGFLSPGGHIAYAAVEGFAIILAMKGRKFTWDTLTQSEFLRIVWIPVALHAFWDADICQQTLFMRDCKYCFLIISIWVVLLVFINRGLHQISEKRKDAQELSTVLEKKQSMS